MKYEDHLKECQRINGPHEVKVCEGVNRIIDQFAHFPRMDMLSNHRQFLHHTEGIAYFKRLYGAVGEACATTHIKLDCQDNVPNMIDYHNGRCDRYGYCLDGGFDFEFPTA